MTVWESNDDVPKKEAEYNINLLEANCDLELGKNKKLPRNSYVVSYMANGVVHNDIIVGESEYGHNFVSVIQKDNIYGTQFHPEKSHDSGKIILKNFLES